LLVKGAPSVAIAKQLPSRIQSKDSFRIATRIRMMPLHKLAVRRLDFSRSRATAHSEHAIRITTNGLKLGKIAQS
jgi:hypothetical protein